VKYALLLALLLPSSGADLFSRSLPLYLGASTLDIASSYGLQERNPILGRGPFGARQTLTSGAITGGVALGAWALARWVPALRRPLGWVVVGMVGVRGGVAVHNWRQHAR
jgi:hypothetical protein